MTDRTAANTSADAIRLHARLLADTDAIEHSEDLVSVLNALSEALTALSETVHPLLTAADFTLADPGVPQMRSETEEALTSASAWLRMLSRST
jgi:hypothetical protein